MFLQRASSEWARESGSESDFASPRIAENGPPCTPQLQLQLRCPVCAHPLGNLAAAFDDAGLTCGQCAFTLLSEKGIWKALRPNRGAYFEQFIRDYEAVRACEGRGSAYPEYYLALPYQDLTGRNEWQWQIRARSFECFDEHVLCDLEAQYPAGLDVLDIGAGNGWMSYRLATSRHRPVAVDLLLNDADGLGAARHYRSAVSRLFPRFQAEMDVLPFVDGQFDLVAFNAAFHYSEDYERTLREALRCLRRGGHVAILDSPFYRDCASGMRMVEEKRSQFEKQYGFRSDSICSREFLYPNLMDKLAAACGIRWRVLRPSYGLRWNLRPVKARLLGKREPSDFFIFAAQKVEQ